MQHASFLFSCGWHFRGELLTQKERIEMRKQQGVLYGLTLAGLLGVSFLGWSHLAPAHAQDNAPPPPGAGMPLPGGPGAVAASGDFVYMLRGNTLWQLKASDLSVANQKVLPAPDNRQAGVQARSMTCPVCKTMDMTAEKMAANAQEVTIKGQTWYCCAGCNMSEVADKP